MTRRMVQMVLPECAFRCIVADPPWKFADKLPGKKRGASKHYQTQTVATLMHMEPCRAMAMASPDAVLFLWRVAAMQQEALDLARSWGFRVVTELVWNKLTRTGKKPHFGMGHYVRGAHEVCLICIRGRVAFRHHSQRSTFSAQVGRHSEKPQKFYDIVESLVLGPRLDLFARRRREGWTSFGDELGEER